MSEEKKNTFYKIYRYKNVEYRIDDNGIGLGLFVNGEYSDDAKHGYVPQGTKITKEREKKLIESGGFEPVDDMKFSLKGEVDTKNKKSKWGGKREGSGRPEGAESQSTKDKKIVKEEMKQRIMRSKDSLLNSQMNLAKGCQFLFVIETIRYEKDGVWKEEKKKPRIVEDQETIEKYLAGELDNEKDEYYFMTTQKPDNKAIDSMFDRAFDKARQNVGLDGGEDDKPINIVQYGDITRKNKEEL